MKVELLQVQGCRQAALTAALVTEVLQRSAPGVELESVLVETPEDAVRLAFPGSPTLRVDGVDVEPEVPTRFGLG